LRDYELVLVVSPEGGEEGFPTTVERVHQFIQEKGGTIKNIDPWGRRRLAYPVQRFTEGYYNITQFSLPPQEIRTLEGSLELAEDVLRHLVVKVEEVRPEKPKKKKPGLEAAAIDEAATVADAGATPAASSEEPTVVADDSPVTIAEEAGPMVAQEAPVVAAEESPAEAAVEEAPATIEAHEASVAEEAEEPGEQAEDAEQS